ncbi:MAG TPA: hypothetical protein VLA75_03430 [Thermoanaerobaculia bacterium]|nr:hypothetical protein [Thermoanaerobaculia bacterium]
MSPLLLLALLLAAPPGGHPGAGDGLGRGDELLRLDCRSELARREVTLFGNGTARLRSGPVGAERLRLAELGPDERDALVDRLRECALAEADSPTLSVSGGWVEVCDLAVHLPGGEAESRRFGRYDSLPLALSRLRELALALADRVEAEGRAGEGLPQGYRPRIGDCLRRLDGRLFEVRGFTGDGKGVELEGIDQPLSVLVLVEELDREYGALEPAAACGR